MAKLADQVNKVKNLLRPKKKQNESTSPAPAAQESKAAPAVTPAPAAQPTPTPSAAAPTAAATTTTTTAPAAPAAAVSPAVQPAATPSAPTQKPTPFARVRNSVRRSTAVAATANGTLRVALTNNSNSSQVYAYITGLAIDNNFALFLLQSDATTPYYPANPSATGTALSANVSIPLGAPGSTVYATIPRIAGGRIWFSQDKPLQFALNPGPGLVEPSIFNPADPNANTNFAFCEFTYNAAQLFVNISYVDFVSALPIALTVEDTTGNTQHIGGMPANGLQTVANGLRAQTAKDGQPWSSLIVQSAGQDLRVLSPNSGITINPSWFQGYYEPYVNQVYSQYKTQPLIVNTQAGYGNVSGTVNAAGNLDYGSGGSFSPPSAKDIFSSNTGPFATGSNAETNVIIPRLAAAFNRSTLLLSNQTPNGTNASQYYQNPITNHYARIVHAANVDGLGYTHPYDDVVPDGGPSQAGVASTGTPTLLTVAVGGNNAYAAGGAPSCVIL